MNQMSELITIYERNGNIDSLGQRSETWVKVAQTWASVSTKTGTETIQGSQLMAIATKFFKIRHIAGLRADMRITYESYNYNIIAIGYDRRDNTVTISATISDNQ